MLQEDEEIPSSQMALMPQLEESTPEGTIPPRLDMRGNAWSAPPQMVKHADWTQPLRAVTPAEFRKTDFYKQYIRSIEVSIMRENGPLFLSAKLLKWIEKN
jgi:hypothetical protein